MTYTKIAMGLSALALISAFSTDASAACRTVGPSHRPGMKELSRTVYVTSGTRCVHRVNPCGHCAVLSVAVVSSPRLGTLRRLGGLEMEYRPRAQAQATDNYTLRWCESPATKGCYLVHYTAHVQ